MKMEIYIKLYKSDKIMKGWKIKRVNKVQSSVDCVYAKTFKGKCTNINHIDCVRSKKGVVRKYGDCDEMLCPLKIKYEDTLHDSCL